MPSVLFLYNAPENSLPVLMTQAIAKQNTEEVSKIIHKIIAIAHENNYANGNLWHNYLTHFILSNENIFSLSCERKDAPEGSLKDFVLHDFEIFMQLFGLSENLAIIKNFTGEASSSPILDLSKKLANSSTPEEFYKYVSDFYKNFGVGILAFNKASHSSPPRPNTNGSPPFSLTTRKFSRAYLIKIFSISR